MSACCCGKGSLRTGCKIISAVELLLGGITLILGCVYDKVSPGAGQTLVYEYANMPAFIGKILTYDVRTILDFVPPPSLVHMD